ncbi:hypothetical protein BE20_07615 [Sorangium cellulosum]|nr:hypothetical protein BE20_07615 [Sorangium cellulosum]
MESQSRASRSDRHQARPAERRRPSPLDARAGLVLRARGLRLAWLGVVVAMSLVCPRSEGLAATTDFTVQYANYNVAAPNDTIAEAGIQLRNNTTATVPLNRIVVRYWFKKNGAAAVTPACWWWSPSCSNITLATGSVSLSGADGYVELRFSSGAGSLAPGATTQPIDLGIQFGVNVDETDDYSYSSQTTFASWSRITVHDAGSAPTGGLRGGTPPSGSVTAPAAPASLTATAVSSSAIALSWSASSGAASYSVYRSTTPGFAPAAGNRIASGVTSTSYNSTGLSASTTYYYKVTASSGGGESAASQQASATTPAGSAAMAELFDDFSYRARATAAFARRGRCGAGRAGPG